MNINNLENLVRQALKGDSAGEKSNAMLNSRAISSVEHKSFNQMTFQMTDMNSGAGAGTVSLRILPTPLTWV
jgi:hypothetical protein